METDSKSEKKPMEKKKIVIISLLGALGLLLVASLVFIFILDNTQSVKVSIENYTFCKGVSIEGTDLSGMTLEQGTATIKGKNFDDKMQISFTVNGTLRTFDGEQIGVAYDLDAILTDAILYGNAGTMMNRIIEKNTALEKGKDFKLELTLNEEKFREQLNSAQGLNTPAQEPTAEFNAGKDGFNPLTEEVFTYHEGVEGTEVDMDQVISLVKEEIKNGNMQTIEVPCKTTAPTTNIDALKATRQLISKYSNTYKGNSNDNPNRVFNFTKLAGIITGMTIEPGEKFSMNDRVGPRYSPDWALAHGLSGGRAIDQPGGGVCQASSCFYMVSILAELEVVTKHNHSWPSTYHPAGLDATISTGSPDLAVKNPYTTPIYIVAFVNTTEKTMNVQFYGAPISHGYTVNYVSTKVTNIEPGKQEIIEATQDPDGNPIAAGQQVEWVKRRVGSVWSVTKRYLDKDGKVVQEFKNWDTVRYAPFRGRIYYNPGTINPGVTPEPSPTTTEPIV